MLCVTWSEGGKTGSTNTSENSSNKAEIYGSLAPGARGVRIPSYSPSSTSLAPIARRLLDGHNKCKPSSTLGFANSFQQGAQRAQLNLSLTQQQSTQHHLITKHRRLSLPIDGRVCQLKMAYLEPQERAINLKPHIMCLPTWHNRSIQSHHIEVHQYMLVALQHLSICKLDHQLAGLNLQAEYPVPVTHALIQMK